MLLPQRLWDSFKSLTQIRPISNTAAVCGNDGALAPASSDDDLLVDAEMAMLDERDRVSFQKWERWYSNLPSDR